MQAELFASDGHWVPVKRCDARARELADRHYSRQTPGSAEFMANGRTLVMLTRDGSAVWGAIEMNDWNQAAVWRCSIFRNEGTIRSSDLIREATARTRAYWRRHYGGVPSAPLRTEVDRERVRHKRDPGRCFIRAGWRVVGVTAARGFVVLEAPEEMSA